LARAEAGPGETLVVDVEPPVELSTPLDADGDGAAETRVTRMLPRHPEGVAWAAGRLLASFTGLLEVGPPARYGPPVVMAWTLDGETLRPAGHTILPFDNPQSIAMDDEGRPWVSCSGVLERADGTFSASSDGALLRLDPVSLEVLQAIPLGDFAPGTPAIADGRITVGSLVSGRIAVLPTDASSLDDGTVLDLERPGTETLFDAAPIGGGLVAVTDFAADSLHVVDSVAAELHPWPFEAPIRLGPPSEVFRGAQAIATRRADNGAPEGAALLGLSAELLPLRWQKVLGP
jgi:hypothetical protein